MMICANPSGSACSVAWLVRGCDCNALFTISTDIFNGLEQVTHTNEDVTLALLFRIHTGMLAD